MRGVTELIAEARALGLDDDLALRVVLAPDPEDALAAAALCRYAGRLDLVGMPLAAARRRIINDRADADVHIDTAPRQERNVFEARNAS